MMDETRLRAKLERIEALFAGASTPGERMAAAEATVVVRVPKRFVDETLWPEFQQLSATLRGFLDEVTEPVVREVLHGDSSEADEVTSRSDTAGPCRAERLETLAAALAADRQ